MSLSAKFTLAALAAALWWGSLTALCGVVVPALFVNLATASLAGQMAAKLFSIQAMVSAICACVFIVLVKPAGRARWSPRAETFAEKGAADTQPAQFGQRSSGEASGGEEQTAKAGVVAGVAQAPVQWGLGCAITGLLLALLVEFAVAPRIMSRENLALWHAVGSGMLLLQWAMALGALVSVVIRRPTEALTNTAG